MGKLKTKNITIRANNKIEFGGETYTHQTLADHVIALHDARAISLKEDLERQFDIGKVFIQIQSQATIWGRKKYSEYLKKYYYDRGITQQHTSDYKFMANNQNDIRKHINSDELNLGQGCSYYRKELKKLTKPKSKTATKTAKPKSKKVTGKVTEAGLAKSTLALIKEHKLDIHKLVKLLTTKKI